MANRINRNLRWVQRKLNQAGITDTVEEEILDALALTEIDILSLAGAVKQIDTVTFDSVGGHATGVYALPTGVNRVIYVGVPAKWARPMAFTNDYFVYDEIKKANDTAEQPLVCYAVNEELRFWPVGTDGDQVELFSFKGTVPYALAEGTGDPTLDWGWDMCLRYGALSILTASEKWDTLFEKEYKRASHEAIARGGAPLIVDHSSRKLGF